LLINNHIHVYDVGQCDDCDDRGDNCDDSCDNRDDRDVGHGDRGDDRGDRGDNHNDHGDDHDDRLMFQFYMFHFENSFLQNDYIDIF